MPGDADHQQRAAARRGRAGAVATTVISDVDDADPDRGEDRPRRGVDAGELDDRRRVVDDRVDAGHLLQDRQPDADHQRRFAPSACSSSLQAPGFSSTLSLISSSSRSIVSGSSTRIFASVARACVVVADHHQPARALRHPQHPDGERQRRQRAEAEHPAPAFDVARRRGRPGRRRGSRSSPPAGRSVTRRPRLSGGAISEM